MDRIYHSLTTKYPELASVVPDIEIAEAMLVATYRQGGMLLLCGNGGSAADCEHIVGELMKGFMSKRRLSKEIVEKFRRQYPGEADAWVDDLQGALPAISLASHTALTTAIANDVAAESVFAQQVYGYGKPGDALIGISTSGNSVSVVRAIQVARVLGMRTIGLTGVNGGRMKELCDVTIRVPWHSTPDVQERHLPIYHALCMLLEKEFFPS